MAAATEPGARAWLGGGSVRPSSPASSPVLGARGHARQGPGPGSERSGGRAPGPAAAGHSFRKVTLTKPTFCHLCSDFVWGLAGFLCDVCNFMSHEKCLKHVRTPCTGIAPSLVRCVSCTFTPTVCPSPAATAASATRMDTRTMTRITTTGGRGTCPPARAARSAGRRVGPPMCRQAHAVCSTALAPECTFGRLRSMVLPPSCVRLLSRNFSKMHCFRIAEAVVPEPGNKDDGADGIATGVLGREALVAPESGKQTLKIFDGNDAIRRNQFRLVTVPRLARSQEVLEVALRAYCVIEDARDFELQALPLPSLSGDTQALGKAGLSGPVEEEGSRVSGPQEPMPEAWVIRSLPRTQEVLKIYPAWLKVGVAYVSIRVTPQSTAQTVVLEVLPLFGRQVEGPESFQLVEVLMGSKQVQRTVLADEEPLLDRLRDIRQTSVRQVSQTRFYVTESRTVTPHVSLFVGGLPPGLSPQEYSHLLHEAMAIKAAVVSVSHVYNSQGELHPWTLEVRWCWTWPALLRLSGCSCWAGTQWCVAGRCRCWCSQTCCCLPWGEWHMKLPSDCCPLLVFVNPKSGGLKGRDLLCSFRRLLNPHQVFELTNGGPLPGFHLFSQVPCFRVLVCGGDGTVGWVLGALEEIRHRLACPEPSVAILPLGTGNDLGRVLRWGAGYSGEDPFSVLVSVDEADAVLMDRWTILLDAQEASSTENSVVDTEPPKIVQMSNYCGIGIDAELSLDFHQAREEEPGKFTSRFHNKGVYVRVGLQKISHSRGLHRELRLQVEQQEVELPSIEGLIFINIPSWGSGADLWGSDSDPRFEKPRMDDGLLEVVGVTGVVHMGQVQGGLRSGIRIAQGSYFRVTLLKATPVQVDGEPWVQAPGHMIISAAGPKVHMLRKAKQRPRKVGTTRDTRADTSSALEGDPK
ncbi:diacylglycerol kinase theta isoform X5 [Ictidomys tridecemlineatus]